MEVCEKERGDALFKYWIKKDIDVCQLHLAKKGLDYVPAGLSIFHYLRYLWLNNNKIREINYHNLNCSLNELYLQNNQIRSITGVMRHLTCLRVLLLHNNQLTNLKGTVAELRKMKHLNTVTFFLNPFAQEPGYRQHVVWYVPSVQILDRREVKPEERMRLFQQLDAERHRVPQSVGSGKQVEHATRIDEGCTFKGPCTPRRFVQKPKNPFDKIHDPNVKKAMQRSIMQFSTLDWKSLPTVRKRMFGDSTQQPPYPSNLFVTFR